MSNDDNPNILKVKCEIVPSGLGVRQGYSKEQRQQIIEMFKIYRNVVFYAGFVRGFGSELDAPDVGALEVLVELKRQADLLPSQFRKLDPEPFDAIEEAIRYCGGK